jgi:hypothetical protein
MNIFDPKLNTRNHFVFNLLDLHNICSGVSQEECDCGSIVAIAIVCGVLIVIVTTYAASITIVWRRNVSMNKKRRTTVTMKGAHVDNLLQYTFLVKCFQGIFYAL